MSFRRPGRRSVGSRPEHQSRRVRARIQLRSGRQLRAQDRHRRRFRGRRRLPCPVRVVLRPREHRYRVPVDRSGGPGTGPIGEVVIADAPVSVGGEVQIVTADGYRFCSGLRSDPFFLDADGLRNGFQFTGLRQPLPGSKRRPAVHAPTGPLTVASGSGVAIPPQAETNRWHPCGRGDRLRGPGSKNRARRPENCSQPSSSRTGSRSLAGSSTRRTAPPMVPRAQSAAAPGSRRLPRPRRSGGGPTIYRRTGQRHD